MRTDQLIAQAARQAAANTAAQRNFDNAQQQAKPSRVELAAAEMMGVPLAPQIAEAADKPLEPSQHARPLAADATPAKPHETSAAAPLLQPKPAATPAPAPANSPVHHSASEAASRAAAAAPGMSADDTGGADIITSGNWHETVPLGNRKIATKGLIFIFGFLGLFFAWAVLFPISSAVVSPGSIVSAGANKLIQHPVGGVVREIKYRDGDVIAEGDVILILDPSASQAELSRLAARQGMLEAQRARLDSEQGANAFDNKVATSGLTLRGAQPGVLKSQSSTDANDLLTEQRREFEAGRKRLTAELDAAASQIEALRDERSGAQAQLAGARKLLAFTETEIAKVKPLAVDGYLPKSRLWDLEKKQLEQLTTITNLEATIDSTGQRVKEAEARFSQLTQADQEKRSEQRTKVLAELAEIRDAVAAATVAVNSTELRSPVAGTLTKMSANTVGGVIKPGDAIAEIVPTNSGLVTEFRVPLDKIKAVNVGQDARIVVTAFNRRTYAPMDGEVIYVSADSETDKVTGDSYFLARARLNADAENNTGLAEIHAGMTTEVYALSEPRVFLSYITQPIRDSFSKAFRETN